MRLAVLLQGLEENIQDDVKSASERISLALSLKSWVLAIDMINYMITIASHDYPRDLNYKTIAK